VSTPVVLGQRAGPAGCVPAEGPLVDAWVSVHTDPASPPSGSTRWP
jgi:hypothetical protein